MFDPAKGKNDTKARKRKAQTDIKGWVLQCLPDDLVGRVDQVMVQEFQCGDPSCSPVDTGIHVMFKGGNPPAAAGIPKEMHLVEMADIREAVERMLNPQRRDPLEALSPAGRTVYEGMAATLAESLETCLPTEAVGRPAEVVVNITRLSRYSRNRQNRSWFSPVSD